MPSGESLRELFDRRYRDLQYKSLAAAHRALGDDPKQYFTYEMLRNYQKGSGPRDRLRIRGLSIILQVDEREILDAMGVPTHGPWKLPRHAEELDIRQRKAIDMVINEFARANRRAANPDLT